MLVAVIDSFGQGITVTPLQMVAAYGAIANGGMLMKPYIVEEVRHSDGRREHTAPTEIRRVIEPRISSLLSGMLVAVIDSGEGSLARVPHYYVAGKTGTAQIADAGKYKETFNHSFIGFGPVENPKFVVFVKFEEPDARFAATTAAPVFRDIAKMLFAYYQVPPER
jgi:cell division protein FtsI/penicillin-binding protein 2